MAVTNSTILVVDDQPANLKVLLAFLEEHDFQVRVAENGERALQTLDYTSPDLILLDVVMPGIDGFETCRRIKANSAIADIPVIFMTALDSVVDKVLGFEAGGVDYITKPFQQLEVLARVRTHLNQRKQQKDLSHALADLQLQSVTLEQRVQERTQALQESNQQLDNKKREIEKKNIALKVLLDQYQATQDEFEAQITSRLKKLVYPYLELLSHNTSREEKAEYLSLVTGHLDSMVTSFSKNLSSSKWNLTRREILIADLIRQGKKTTEIGRLLKISPRTAETHRNNIRKKLGLTNKKNRLFTYLCSATNV